MAENTTNPPPDTLVLTVVDEQKLTSDDAMNHHQQQKQQHKEEKPTKSSPKTPLKSIKTKQIKLATSLTTFLLSLPILVGAIWLLYIQQYDCEGLLKSLPRLQYGVAIGLICAFVVSNAVVYSAARCPAPAPALIVVAVPLVVMFVVGLTLKGSFDEEETRQIPASPGWLRTKVRGDDSAWEGIKTCLYGTRVCRDLVMKSYNLKSYEDFSTAKFSPIESGCCNPPSACEMEFVNMTYWIRKPNRPTTTTNIRPYDTDCDSWENDETVLCYDCGSCRQAFVTTLEGKWLGLGTFLVVMSMLLMISHLLLFVATMWNQYGS